MEKCSIIIIAYNEENNIKQCLESVLNVSYSQDSYEIIVVDNNSTDNTVEIVKSFDNVIFVSETRQGRSFARVKGISYANNDILVFLDADSIVSKQWLTLLMAPFKDDNVGGVGGEIQPFVKGNIISEYLGISLFNRYHRYGRQREIKGYPGCNLAVKKSILTKEDSNRWNSTEYGQDKYFCGKVLKQGYKLLFQPKAIIYHKHPISLTSLTTLIKSGAKGRAVLSLKGENTLDVLFFKLHIPLIYLFFLVVSLVLHNTIFLVSLFAPFLIYIFLSSYIAFSQSKKGFISFLIKPILDTYAIMLTYITHHFYLTSNDQKV